MSSRKEYSLSLPFFRKSEPTQHTIHIKYNRIEDVCSLLCERKK